MSSRTTASHWILFNPQTQVCTYVEKLRPALRALLSPASESEVARTALAIYKAPNDKGHSFPTSHGSIVAIRRVMWDFYPKLAQHLAGVCPHPVSEDLEQFMKTQVLAEV